MHFLAALNNKLKDCRFKDTIGVQAYSVFQIKRDVLHRQVYKWTNLIIYQHTAIMRDKPNKREMGFTSN
jgi:hypothetical protein